ncbi:MAG: hypothetical protein ACYCTB_09260 [bacterium]
MAVKEKFYFNVARKILIEGIGLAIHRGLTIEVPEMFFALSNDYGNGRENLLDGKIIKITVKNYNADPIHEPDGIESSLYITFAEGKDNSKEIWESIKQYDFFECPEAIKDNCRHLILDYRPTRKLVLRLISSQLFCTVDLITK